MKESGSSLGPIRRLGKLEAFTSGFIFQHFEDRNCCGQHGELGVRKKVREKHLWKLSKHICCIHRLKM